MTEDAVTGLPSVSQIAAVDDEGKQSIATIESIGPEPAGSGEPGVQGGTQENTTGDVPAEIPVDGQPESVTSVVDLPVSAFVAETSGAGELEMYRWQAPEDDGSCPAIADVLTARPSGATALVSDTVASSADSAPMLAFEADFAAAGDYAVYVCGCAPEYSGDVGSSPRANNDSVYVGSNGVAAASGENSNLPITGFAGADGFVWQTNWLDEASGTTGATVVPIGASGPNQINLWMAEDGLLVRSLRLIPVESLAGSAPAAGENCVSPAE